MMKCIGWDVRTEDDTTYTVALYRDGNVEMEVYFLWRDVMGTNEDWSRWREYFLRSKAKVIITLGEERNV